MLDDHDYYEKIHGKWISDVVKRFKDKVSETPTEVLDRYVSMIDSRFSCMNPIRRVCATVDFYTGLDAFRYDAAREELALRKAGSMHALRQEDF